MDFGEARANLREIPEDVSVRKPPLKEEARRQRTLTLENDELLGMTGGVFYTAPDTNPSNHAKIRAMLTIMRGCVNV